MPQGSYKICPQCQRSLPVNAPQCSGCGRRFSTQFTPPPVQQTQAYAPPPSVDPLSELARRYRDSKSTFTITLIVGLFCLWPLWILTYIEYNRMRKITDDVGALGVDVNWWKAQFRLK